MKTLNIAEARQKFSAIVDEVRLGGEAVVISKYGRPAVMITRLESMPDEEKAAAEDGHKPNRDWRDELGLRNPSFQLDPDFDEPMDYLWEVFDDNVEEPTP